MCTAARKKKQQKKQQKKNQPKKRQQWKQKKRFIGLAIRGINKTLLVYSALGFELFNLGLCTQDFHELRFHTLFHFNKVQVFWEGHKNLRHPPYGFDVY